MASKEIPRHRSRAALGRALVVDGIGVHNEYVQQPDRQGQADPA